MRDTTLPTAETMYDAFIARDSRYEGLFYTGVKSTGIFCRPTCRAKKPKRENVLFFATAKEALDFGFRPCKVCRPMEPVGGSPAWLAALLSRMSDGDSPALRDADLRRLGLSPAAVRRWFKRHHGMTFHAYARQARIAEAYGTIRADRRVIDTAFDSGYGSLSGFTEAFKRATGFSPSRSKEQRIVTLTRIPTPLGAMVAAAEGERLCLLEFADRPMLEHQLSTIRRLFDAEIVAGMAGVFETLQSQLAEYFGGKRQEFDLPLAAPGSPFQRAVWKTLSAIPYGETRSYAQQAAAIGKQSAVRAVARANGANRIAILIPCHRVIGSDGTLTGYGGGIWRKRYLLDLERKTGTAVETRRVNRAAP